jgi:deoxyribose-phosphate aldolase
VAEVDLLKEVAFVAVLLVEEAISEVVAASVVAPPEVDLAVEVAVSLAADLVRVVAFPAGAVSILLHS